MDVATTLIEHAPFIVDQIIHNVIERQDDKELFEAFYEVMEHEISIHFDSVSFYLTDYALVNETCVYFSLKPGLTPPALLHMTKGLIEHRRMDENIKNDNYRIHLRSFNELYALEDPDNSIRSALFQELVKRYPTSLRAFLARRLVDCEDKIVRYRLRDTLYKLNDALSFDNVPPIVLDTKNDVHLSVA